MTNYFISKANAIREEISRFIFRAESLGLETAVCYDYVCSSTPTDTVDNKILPLSILFGAVGGAIFALKFTFFTGPIMQLASVAVGSTMFGAAAGMKAARSYIQLYKDCDCEKFTKPNTSLIYANKEDEIDALLKSPIIEGPNSNNILQGKEGDIFDDTIVMQASKAHNEREKNCNYMLQKQMEDPSFAAAASSTKDHIDIAGNNTAQGEETV